MFNRYTSGRELYFQTSEDAVTWETAVKIAGAQGHYQRSAQNGNKVATTFNRRPSGNVDARTDIYYMQTTDRGQTWTQADGTALTIPVNQAAHAARVIDYASQNLLVYMKDLVFDDDGYPVIFYLTSNDFRPGPAGEPRLLRVTRWTGNQWATTTMPASATATSTLIHNYSAGSLHIEGATWTVVAPTGSAEAPAGGPSRSELYRYLGQGGEMETWTSTDQGAS